MNEWNSELVEDVFFGEGPVPPLDPAEPPGNGCPPGQRPGWIRNPDPAAGTPGHPVYIRGCVPADPIVEIESEVGQDNDPLSIKIQYFMDQINQNQSGSDSGTGTGNEDGDGTSTGSGESTGDGSGSETGNGSGNDNGENDSGGYLGNDPLQDFL